MTTYTYTGAVAWNQLGPFITKGAGVRSVTITDPATSLVPANLTQAGAAVTAVTADANGLYSFSCDVPGVIVNFGAGPIALYANEVPGLAVAGGGTSAAQVDARMKWAPSTAYTLGQQILAPANEVVSALSAHTSSAAYASDPTRWLRPGVPRLYTSTTGDQTAALQSFLTGLVDGDAALIRGTINFTTVTIARNNVTIRLDPGAVLNKTTAATDGILVTGTGVRLERGTITSPATFDGTNVQPTYAVIRSTAVGTTVADMTLTNVPKVGIYADEGSDLRVTGCTITGNYPAGSYTGTETGHFGIAVNPSASGSSGRSVIYGNIIRSCVQGAFLGNYGATATGAEGTVIAANVFDGCHNHGVYGSSGFDGINVNGNAFVRCQTPVALTGAGHVVTGNLLYTHTTGNGVDTTGISMREATGCAVTGNTIKGDGGVGTTVIDITNNVAGGSLSRNVVNGNTIDAVGGSVVAIRVGHVTNTSVVCSDNLITGNTVRAVGRVSTGVIALNPASGSVSFGNKITENTVVCLGDNHGIQVLNTSHATVQNNSVRYEYDAITPVTLTVAALSGDTTLTISSNAAFPGMPFTAILESEQVTVTASTATTATVTRGVNSTTAAAHAIGVFVRLPATKTLGALVLNTATYCTVTSNDVHGPATFGTNVALRGLWEQTGSAKNRYTGNGYHGDLTKLTSFTPIVLITNSDAYLDERGIGSPSGAFYGAPGSRWSREDGGTATSLYIKETANTSATWAATFVTTPTAQTLSANGAVVINAANSDSVITLQANATSSSVTNPTLNQRMAVTWVQDATGGRSYVWPTNCKFAAAAPPTDTTASKRSTVTFLYDGTNWNELSRAVSVG